MNTKQYCLSIAILACLSAVPAQANTHKAKAKASPSPTISQAAKAPDQAAMPAQVSMAEQPTSSQGRNISKRGKYSLSPLPVDIYLQPNERPTVAFTTPCIMIEKATHGFPPILAFETMMFTVIGNVNESNMLPARLEPVCV
jgi:hypothetical protein